MKSIENNLTFKLLNVGLKLKNE